MGLNSCNWQHTMMAIAIPSAKSVIKTVQFNSKACGGKVQDTDGRMKVRGHPLQFVSAKTSYLHDFDRSHSRTKLNRFSVGHHTSLGSSIIGKHK
eukprot:2283085-Amphidinium_carterae.1